MENAKRLFKRIAASMPVIAVVGASFFPLQSWVRQALILFMLVWFYILMII
jgi:hypothetical protein